MQRISRASTLTACPDRHRRQTSSTSAGDNAVRTIGHLILRPSEIMKCCDDPLRPPFLPRDSFEFHFAEDGETGLHHLLAGVFDLAIVDLRMPPDRWGGLWLLDQIQRLGLGVDTLVLTGEAGRRETMEAHRLGAAGFVDKDIAEDELAAHVEQALARGAEARTAFALTQLPTPIAIPYQRTRAARENDSRLQASLHAAEAILRFCSLAAIARLRADRRDTTEVVQTLYRPSFGTWAATCRSLTKTIGPDPMRRWLQGAVINVEAIVQHRNDTAHGGGIPSGGIETRSPRSTSGRTPSSSPRAQAPRSKWWSPDR